MAGGGTIANTNIGVLVGSNFSTGTIGGGIGTNGLPSYNEPMMAGTGYINWGSVNAYRPTGRQATLPAFNGGSPEARRIIAQFNRDWNLRESGYATAGEGAGGPGDGKESCPHCLNLATVKSNYFGTYPGPNNPLSYNGEWNYSYVPSNWAEYPAIGHDRRYDKLNVQGASGLFLDTRAIGADWKFVSEQMKIAFYPHSQPIGDRMSAAVLGIGLGLSALPKTIFQLCKPTGYVDIYYWYYRSSYGVNNEPTIHKH